MHQMPVNRTFLHRSPLCLTNGAKSGFEMCFGPSTLGAGAKPRLESRIKNATLYLQDTPDMIAARAEERAIIAEWLKCRDTDTC